MSQSLSCSDSTMHITDRTKRTYTYTSMEHAKTKDTCLGRRGDGGAQVEEAGLDDAQRAQEAVARAVWCRGVFWWLVGLVGLPVVREGGARLWTYP